MAPELTTDNLARASSQAPSHASRHRRRRRSRHSNRSPAHSNAPEPRKDVSAPAGMPETNSPQGNSPTSGAHAAAENPFDAPALTKSSSSLSSTSTTSSRRSKILSMYPRIFLPPVDPLLEGLPSPSELPDPSELPGLDDLFKGKERRIV